MGDASETVEQRRAGRASWPVHRRTLTTMEDASALHATPLQRLAMVWELTEGAYALAGVIDPQLPRQEWPSQLIRRGKP